MLACSAAQAQMTGPEGRVYDVRTERERYTAQFQPGGAYQDDRPRTGRWQFDGRTLCMLIAAAVRKRPNMKCVRPGATLRSVKAMKADTGRRKADRPTSLAFSRAGVAGRG
ncbi:MAG: hypothetical protein JKP95_02760 [Oceanicaulis sp.]|nr:hypothetical protein [Oceanicaulis sp.]